MTKAVRTRRALALVTVGLCVAAAGGCGARAEQARERGGAAALRRVRVAFRPHLSWGPLMIAKAEGFFEDEGIAAEFVTSLRSEEALVALVTGDIDVNPGPLHAGFLSAIARGAPVRIAAGMAELDPDGCSYFAIVVRPGIDTSGAPALKRMRTSQDGGARFLVSRMLASRNLPLDNVETVRLPEAVMAMSLENGSLDAAAVSEPALTRLRRSGTQWLRGEDAFPNFQWGVLAFGERLLVRDRDTGLRVLRAYQRGVARYNEGKTERNVAIIARESGAPPEDVREACWPAFAPDSRVNWASIAAFQAWANAERLMEHTLSPAQASDPDFLAAAAGMIP